MNNRLNISGIIIACSSSLAFVDPNTWHLTLPVVFALGCIVYGLGEVIKAINRMQKNQQDEVER